MEALHWIGERWFDLLQTVGIIAGLLFTGYTTWNDEKATRIANLIAIAQQHREIWQELYERPELFRVLKTYVDLNKHPISNDEWLFVKMLILHLDTVHRAMKVGMFVKLEGLQKDIGEFFGLPIPKALWEQIKPLQDEDFVKFIEASLK